MRYVKITKENADSLLVTGVILTYSKKGLQENESGEITEDITLIIDNRIDSKQVTIIKPDGSDSQRYEIDYFTDGHWWIEDFAMAAEHQNNYGAKIVTLFGGMALLAIGIYLFVENVSISGNLGPGRAGNGGGSPTTISWPFVILFGLALLFSYFKIVRDERKKQ